MQQHCVAVELLVDLNCDISSIDQRVLTSFEQALAEEFVEFGDFVNFVDDGLNRIFQANEIHVFAADNGIAGAGIAVTGLADTAGIDNAFFTIVNAIATVEIRRRVEVRFVGEDTCYVGVSAEAAFFDAVENLCHLGW